MSWSLKVGRLAGIEIYVHFTFFILLLWFVSNERSQGQSWGDVWLATAILLGAFFCVVLHELGHALTARQFGIKTRDIVILPIGGVARLERMPRIAWQELVVAIAGPIVSAGIAILIGIVFAIQNVPLNSALEGTVGTINQFWANLLALNVILVLFNLIPAFPMDGGRVFRSLLAMGIGRLQATKVASFVGQTISLLFLFYGIATSQWLLAFVGAFIFLAARTEGRETVQESLLNGYRVEQAMFYHFPQLSADTPVSRIIALFLNVEPGTYAIVRKDGTFFGFFDDDDLCQAIKTQRIAGKTVADICTPCSHYLTRNVSVLDARNRLRETGFGVLPVLENGKLVGVFTVNNINRLMDAVAACRSVNARLNLDNIQKPEDLASAAENTEPTPAFATPTSAVSEPVTPAFDPSASAVSVPVTPAFDPSASAVSVPVTKVQSSDETEIIDAILLADPSVSQKTLVETSSIAPCDDIVILPETCVEMRRSRRTGQNRGSGLGWTRTTRSWKTQTGRLRSKRK